MKRRAIIYTLYMNMIQSALGLLSLNEATIHEAVQTWISDLVIAKSKYGGNISSWNVSTITTMRFEINFIPTYLFYVNLYVRYVNMHVF